MSDRLEQELSRTLAGAAGAAPEADEAFVGAVHARQRGIRRRRATALAGACATAVLVTAVGAAVAIGANERPSPVAPYTGTTASAAPPAQVALSDAQAADQLWPGAVRRLPGRLPDGRAYAVAAIVDGQRYVVHPRTGAAQVLLWTPGSGSVNELGRLVQPQGRTGYALNHVFVRSGYAIWITGPGGLGVGGQDQSEVWAAPLAGGEPTRLVRAAMGYTVERVAVVGPDLILRDLPETGINDEELLRVPLTGGPAERVPGSKGYDLLETAPWAIRAGAGPTELWNLETGERRTHPAYPEPMHYSYCSATWCVGTDTTSYSLAQRWDGNATTRASFPVWLDFTANPDVALGISPITGTDVTSFVWQLSTGKLGRVPVPTRAGDGSSAYLIPHWLGASGDLLLLDPAAIR